jgi:hypothetical protein
MEDQELRQLRRLLGLLLVNLEPPLPPLRRILEQQGSFEATEPLETKPNPSSRGEHLILVKPTISNLRLEAIGPYNPPITDLSAPIIIQVKPYERQVVSQATMDKNVATYSRNPHIPSTAVTTGGFPPPNQPSSVWTTMVSIASTYGNGLIPSMEVITAHFTQSVIGPPFSYKIPGFDMNSVLSYSTLQTLGLGAWSSNAPLQESMGGTSAPYDAFPYGGGHIPPSSPLLGSAHQHSAGPNVNYSSFGGGSQGIPSYIMPIGSTPFSLINVFGNNAFSSATISTKGNPDYGQQNLVQGTIPTQGKNSGIPSSQGPWNLWQGSFPSSGMPTMGIPFHSQWNLGQGSRSMPIGSVGGNLSQNPWNATQAQPFTSYYGSHPMTSQQAQNLYASHNHGYYQNPGQQPNFSWQPSVSQTPGSFFPGYNQQPKLSFLATLHLPDLTRLLNDAICHDPRWPPMPTKLPLDIPKFESKPNKDLGDHVTTFHLWCSSNSLRDDSVQLRLFQRTLIGSAAKWYIELEHSR